MFDFYFKRKYIFVSGYCINYNERYFMCPKRENARNVLKDS